MNQILLLFLGKALFSFSKLTNTDQKKNTVNPAWTLSYRPFQVVKYEFSFSILIKILFKHGCLIRPSIPQLFVNEESQLYLRSTKLRT